jgi:hypothetical protein
MVFRTPSDRGDDAMASRRAILERLERGLTKDIKRTTKRLDVIRKLIALEHENEGALRIAAARRAGEELIEAACGLLEAHGGEMHVRELEQQLAALAGEDRVVNLHAQIRRHPERIVPRQNGFLALAPSRPRKQTGHAAEVPTWPPKILQLGSSDAAKNRLRSPKAAKRKQGSGHPERPS